MLRTPWADITTYGAILQEAGDNHKLIKEIKQTDTVFFSNKWYENIAMTQMPVGKGAREMTKKYIPNCLGSVL